MKSSRSIGAATLLTLLQCATATAADKCTEPDPLAPETVLTLTNVNRIGQEFVGEFELQNLGIRPSLVVPGHQAGGDFYVEIPTISIQFRDLNGSWVTLANHPPGTFLPAPDKRDIKVGAKAVLKINLFATDWNELSGSDFRVTIQPQKPAECIVSDPFRAYPDHGSVTHIKSLPKTDLRQRREPARTE